MCRGDRSGSPLHRMFSLDLNSLTTTHIPMNIASTLLLAFAMSTDAFAAAVGKSATLHRPRIREAFRTGLIFGVIEALTPLVGWALGKAPAPYVASWDHWIAFSLLLVLGVRMISSGLRTPAADVEKPRSHSRFLAAGAYRIRDEHRRNGGGSGTRFHRCEYPVDRCDHRTGDAVIMVTLGVMIGRFLGKAVGQRAEIVGGFILVVIGSVILAEHLGYMS